MKANEFIFKANQGKNSTLDKAYNRHINNLINTLDEEKQARWETYNLIIQELINDGKSYYFSEIKYRLTDGEDPNKVMIDMIDRNKNNSGLLWFIRKRLLEYIDEDFYNRFL